MMLTDDAVQRLYDVASDVLFKLKMEPEQAELTALLEQMKSAGVTSKLFLVRTIIRFMNNVLLADCIQDQIERTEMRK
jgi:hypothetical protein